MSRNYKIYSSNGKFVREFSSNYFSKWFPSIRRQSIAFTEILDAIDFHKINEEKKSTIASKTFNKALVQLLKNDTFKKCFPQSYTGAFGEKFSVPLNQNQNNLIENLIRDLSKDRITPQGKNIPHINKFFRGKIIPNISGILLINAITIAELCIELQNLIGNKNPQETLTEIKSTRTFSIVKFKYASELKSDSIEEIYNQMHLIDFYCSDLNLLMKTVISNKKTRDSTLINNFIRLIADLSKVVFSLEFQYRPFDRLSSSIPVRVGLITAIINSPTIMNLLHRSSEVSEKQVMDIIKEKKSTNVMLLPRPLPRGF